METIITAIVTAVFTGLFTVILPKFLERRWKKKDDSNDALEKKVDAIVEAQGHIIDAQRVIMVDRVRYIGSSYIRKGEITLSEKENLKEMKEAYDALPGANGHLTATMDEVEKLRVVAG